jgi:tripartite-type tricarboxylate transporter receptor subunit TctC
LTHIASGKLRALGVSSTTRYSRLPDVPTFIEQGYPQLSATEWLGLLARAGTPEPVVQKLNSAVNQAMQSPAARSALSKLGVDTMAVTPQEFRNFLATETRKWAQVVTEAGIKGD